jgi:ribonuclease R
LPTDQPELITGRISLHPRGFGFITVPRPHGPSDSYFVAPPDLNPFLADDLVEAEAVAGEDGRHSARALRLLERPRYRVYGQVNDSPTGLRLAVDPEVANTAWPLGRSEIAVKPGQFVIARLDDRRAVPIRIIDPDADHSLERIVARHNLSDAFPPACVHNAREVARRPHSLGARRDLREIPTVTVDAPSTRDIDDAVAVMPAGPDGALRLLVSIADVAEFVRPDSPLDQEASLRATSVYMAGRMLPMLPDELSGEWLSLLPRQDRSCLTVEMRIDPEGNITAVDVYASLIRSAARLNYQEMGEYLDRGVLSAAMAPVAPTLPWFRTAAARLGIARSRRGGVQFARDEARIQVNPVTGEPAAVEALRPTSAHLMIERFMVAANEAIATWLQARGVPALYRVHSPPEFESVSDLEEIAHNFGFATGFGGRISPLSLAAFDAQVTGTESELALRSVMMRTLGPARYTVNPGLHFGLAAPLYLHFTSPIRRYADLQVHRVIKQYLDGFRDFNPTEPAVESLGIHVNERSQAASRAERDRQRVLVARYLGTRIGATFTARITRARSFGLIAQLDKIPADGLIPVESVPGGPFRLDPRETALIGRQKRYVLGMPVEVTIAGTDPELGRVELTLVNMR